MASEEKDQKEEQEKQEPTEDSGNEPSSQANANDAALEGNVAENDALEKNEEELKSDENAKLEEALEEVEILGEKMKVSKEELKKGYQRARASNEKFQQAAKLKREAEEREAKLSRVVAELRRDPIQISLEILAHELGPQKAIEKMKELSGSWLAKIIEEELLPDAEKMKVQARKKDEEVQRIKDDYERRLKAYEEEKLEARRQAQAEELGKKYESDILAAFKVSGLDPDDIDTVMTIHKILTDGAEVGLDITMNDAVDIVAESRLEHLSKLDGLSKDAIAKNEQALKSIAQIHVDQVKAKQNSARSTTQGTTRQTSTAPIRRASAKQVSSLEDVLGAI